MTPGLLTGDVATADVESGTSSRRYQKLKPGPGLSADEVVTNQRARLFGAMIGIVAEEGFGGVKVRELSLRAGVSTRTFYQHFANLEECFAATYAWILSEALHRATRAADPGPASLRARFETLLSTFAEHPRAGRLALLEACGAGQAAADRERAAVRVLERIIHDDLNAGPDPVTVPVCLVRGVAAATFRIGRRQILNGDPAEVGRASAELSQWVLTLRDQAVIRLSAAGRRVPRRGPAPCPQERSFGDARRRLLDAAARLAVTDGFADMTVPRIRREAGVSRRDFDACFDSVTECFLEAIEMRIMDAVGRAEEQAIGAPGWPQAITRSARALCAELARDPTLAQLAFVDVFLPGRAGLERRDRIVARIAERLFGCAPADAHPEDLTIDASLAAAWRIVETEVGSGRREHLDAIAPIVSYVVLASAVGPVAAEQAIAQEFHLEGSTDPQAPAGAASVV